MSIFCNVNPKTWWRIADKVFERCPASVDVVAYGHQIILNGMLDIPFTKPPIEQMFNAIHEIDINKCTVITVRKPPGKKVLIAGKIMIGIEYIAAVHDQKFHFVHWDLPFQVLIKNQDGSPLSPDFDLSRYNVYVCVEHEDFHQISERTIVYDIVLLIWLEPNGL